MRAIKLTQGKVALVDDADYEHLQWKWHAHFNGFTWVAKRHLRRTKKNVTGKTIRMHRYLLKAPAGVDVDINGNTLDNRRGNIRLCNRTLNNANRRVFRGKSRFKGIYWRRDTQKWQVRVGLKHILWLLRK